jgi:lipid-binding SYLF domain-containing protein
MIMFMTPEALEKFRNSSGREAGANAQVTMIDEGKAADISSVMADNPVFAFVFGQKGLMGPRAIAPGTPRRPDDPAVRDFQHCACLPPSRGAPRLPTAKSQRRPSL